MVEAGLRRVVLVGGDRLALDGLSHRLESETDPSQLVTASPDESGLDEDADVCVWDLGSNPDEELALPTEIPVVVLVSDGAVARRAFATGARGVLLRDASGARIARAIDAVLEGLVIVDVELAEEAMRTTPRTNPWEPLTPRELEVLDQLALGLTNKEIASRLGVSPHTAKFHVNSLMAKLGATSRTEAVALAARTGLITF